MGKYVIFANFDGDDYYKAKRSPSLFLQGVNPHLNITVTEIEVLTYNESNTISGNLKDNNGTNLTSYPVSIKILTPDNTTTTLTTNTDNNGNFTTSYTPTTRGAYTIWVETSATDSYSRTVSKEQLVLTDTLDTTTSISCDVDSVIVDNNVQLVATVLECNNRVGGVEVQFYDGSTRIYDVTNYNTSNNVIDSSKKYITNQNGQFTLNYPVNSVKSYSFKAVAQDNSSYNGSTSSTISVTGIKHTLTVKLQNSTVYKGWTPRILVMDEENEPVSGLTFTVVNGSETLTLTSDSSGLLTLPSINTVGTRNITVSLPTNTKYQMNNNTSQTLVLTVKDTITSTVNNLTATNESTSIPYKKWENLSNMKVAGDGNYANCGSNCYRNRNVLASNSGSYNTPATLKFSNLGLDIPDGALLDKVVVNMSIRTLSCSSDSAEIKIEAPTLNMLNRSSTMQVPSTGRLPFKNFGTVTGEIDLSNVTVGQLNSNGNYFTISFPKNKSSNVGKLEIDYVELIIKYTPQEGDV